MGMSTSNYLHWQYLPQYPESNATGSCVVFNNFILVVSTSLEKFFMRDGNITNESNKKIKHFHNLFFPRNHFFALVTY